MIYYIVKTKYRGVKMSIEKVKEYFAEYGREDDILEFDKSSATVELAAQAANVIPARIAKTLSFKNKEGDNAILVVVAGDAKIDNKKYKSEFATKAKMLTPEEVIKYIGHAIGGVCPFAIENKGVKVNINSLNKIDKKLLNENAKQLNYLFDKYSKHLSP